MDCWQGSGSILASIGPGPLSGTVRKRTDRRVVGAKIVEEMTLRESIDPAFFWYLLAGVILRRAGDHRLEFRRGRFSRRGIPRIVKYD